MGIIGQIIFLLLLGFSIYLFSKNILKIRKRILLGRDKDISDRRSERIKNMILLALGQKKMFKRPIPAVLHFIVYAGFIIINIEIIEIIIDGLIGTHRIFAAPLGQLYFVLIGLFEILSALTFVACSIFLIRRNILKLKRLNQSELDGWPKSDANLILTIELILMSLFLIMNAADYNLQQMSAEHYVQLGQPFWISQYIAPLFSGLSEGTLVMIERGAWWIHILGILFFLNYLPYSKHLHILLAFPNAYYAKLTPKGEMTNMEDIQKEVLYMMDPSQAPTDMDPNAEPPKFGAKDVTDLTWKNLLDAYSCTECGRCTAMCPANITGKLLSPRKIMMDTRDRLEEIGKNIEQNKEFIEDGKSLLHDYITVEELRACTTCNACVEACPVSIDPLDIILQLRRNLIMEESNAPQEWNLMFGNIENNMAPWKFSPDDRDKWAEELNAQS